MHMIYIFKIPVNGFDLTSLTTIQTETKQIMTIFVPMLYDKNWLKYGNFKILLPTFRPGDVID